MPKRVYCLVCVLVVSVLVACEGEAPEDCRSKVGADASCACDDSYVGVGIRCVDGKEVDIDECAGVSCGDGGSCTHVFGETTPGNYTCVCATGYEGGGLNTPCWMEEDDVICPITDVVEDPVVVRKFQENDLEHEVTEGRYRVIVPLDYASIADDLLAILPDCEEYIETFLGYCRPWSESIVHLGVFSSTKSKVENGVVYLGRMPVVFSNWIHRDYWGEATRVCGDNTLAHETVHTFQTPHAPAWLKEGQAQYLADVVLGYKVYQCNESDMEICSDTGCTTYPYWDLSNNNWEGGNKHLYYKTGACFWKILTDAYDTNKLREVTRSLAASPLEEVGVFPFSAQTNALIINHHFVPYLDVNVWPKIARFGISAN